MKASDIMRRPVVAATPTATARDVAIQLLMGEFSGVPVAKSDGTVVGVVTELDLIRAVTRVGKALETTLAEEIMTREVTSVDVGTPLDEIMKGPGGEEHHSGPGDRQRQARRGHLAVRRPEGNYRTQVPTVFLRSKPRPW
jgi:CBS-domain-containing membrane protein